MIILRTLKKDIIKRQRVQGRSKKISLKLQMILKKGLILNIIQMHLQLNNRKHYILLIDSMKLLSNLIHKRKQRNYKIKYLNYSLQSVVMMCIILMLWKKKRCQFMINSQPIRRRQPIQSINLLSSKILYYYKMRVYSRQSIY